MIKWEIYKDEDQMDYIGILELERDIQFNDQVLFEKMIDHQGIDESEDIENLEFESYDDKVYIWKDGDILCTLLKEGVYYRL